MSTAPGSRDEDEDGSEDREPDLPERVIVVREVADTNEADIDDPATRPLVLSWDDGDGLVEVVAPEPRPIHRESESPAIVESPAIAEERPWALRADDDAELLAAFAWPEPDPLPEPKPEPVPEPEPEPAPFAWPEPVPVAMAPEPVPVDIAPEPVEVAPRPAGPVAHDVTSLVAPFPQPRRAASRIRAAVTLVVVVLVAGVALAAAVGAAVLVISLVLSKAFGG